MGLPWRPRLWCMSLSMRWAWFFCFGTQAARLGFMVTLVQAEFPGLRGFCGGGAEPVATVEN